MSAFTPRASQDEARADLIARFDRLRTPHGEPVRVYVVSRHVSSSGMTRFISLFVVANGELADITVAAAAVMGERVHDRGGFSLKVGGAGMDMHFATVYALSCAVYGNQGGYTLRHETV